MMSSTAGSREKLLDVFYGIYRQDTQQVPAPATTATVSLLPSLQTLRIM